MKPGALIGESCPQIEKGWAEKAEKAEKAEEAEEAERVACLRQGFGS